MTMNVEASQCSGSEYANQDGRGAYETQHLSKRELCLTDQPGLGLMIDDEPSGKKEPTRVLDSDDN